MSHLLQFEGFSAYYKQKKNYVVAVDEVSFDIDDGEFAVLVGPSGCGKTTLLKCIMGSMEYTSGRLLFNGEEVKPMKQRDKQMAYVSQEYSLYPTMTVYENIAFPLRVMHTPPDELDKRVRDIAKRLDIGWLFTRKPKQLSGGQHQRIAIARALIKNPRLVLLDEPFANLHPELRFQMRELVKKLHSEQRVTFVFVTHDIGEAFGLADKIIVMNDGSIEQIGTPDQIKNKPTSPFVKEFFGV